MVDFSFKVGNLIREHGYENRYGIITDMPTDDEIAKMIKGKLN